jgi:hypothetical protein
MLCGDTADLSVRLQKHSNRLEIVCGQPRAGTPAEGE